ncbi:MAG: hypothetical protein ACTS8P_03195 [Arsenophonus sp. NC-XBC3-MAG3]
MIDNELSTNLNYSNGGGGTQTPEILALFNPNNQYITVLRENAGDNYPTNHPLMILITK